MKLDVRPNTLTARMDLVLVVPNYFRHFHPIRISDFVWNVNRLEGSAGYLKLSKMFDRRVGNLFKKSSKTLTEFA